MKAIPMPRPTTVNYNSAVYEAMKYRNEISRAVQAADEDPRPNVSHVEVMQSLDAEIRRIEDALKAK